MQFSYLLGDIKDWEPSLMALNFNVLSHNKCVTSVKRTFLFIQTRKNSEKIKRFYTLSN